MESDSACKREELVQEASREMAPSSFVTVVAWIFIAFGGLTTFISLLQNVVINTVFPTEQFRAAQSGVPMPAAFAWIFDHVRLFFFLFLVVSATTLISAIGLLRRRNWARRAFVGILALGIAWNLIEIGRAHV